MSQSFDVQQDVFSRKNWKDFWVEKVLCGMFVVEVASYNKAGEFLVLSFGESWRPVLL